MSYLSTGDRAKVTVKTLRTMKERHERIAMLTCYDYTSALLMDSSGVDAILVGDSAANVMCGHSTTLPITLDQMITYGSSVVRAVRHAFVVVDMPFGTVTVDLATSLHHCIRVMQETGADAVKIEGAGALLPVIEAITSAGIPVVGHLGLTPQSVHALGGYGLQAKAEEEAAQLLSSAQELQRVGCCAVVLEKIPTELATTVSQSIGIPTIGIGAGAGTDGQVLVMQDMLGLNEGFKPKFLRHFAALAQPIRDAFDAYAREVKSGSFPSSEESY